MDVMSEEEERFGFVAEQDVVGEALAPQLGTDSLDLDLGRFDMRRLTVIEKEQIGFLLYARIRAKKSKTWRLIYNELLNLYPSVGGRGRRDIIRMAAVSKGIPASVEGEIERHRPNILARNIYRRDWEEKERERLGIE